MPPVPAFCDACDLIFPSPIGLENSTGITFEGIGVSCPRCGQTGRILDGVYDNLGDTIRGLLQMSPDELRALRASLQQFQGQAAVAEYDSTLLNFSHSHAFLLTKESTKSYARLTLLCLIINTLLAGWTAYHQKSSLSQAEVEAIVQKAILSQPKMQITQAQPQAQLSRNRAERRKAKHK